MSDQSYRQDDAINLDLGKLHVSGGTPDWVDVGKVPYGLVSGNPNAATSNATKLTAAIASFAGGPGGTVFVPRGTYHVTYIPFFANDVRILGSGGPITPDTVTPGVTFIVHYRGLAPGALDVGFDLSTSQGGSLENIYVTRVASHADLQNEILVDIGIGGEATLRGCVINGGATAVRSRGNLFASETTIVGTGGGPWARGFSCEGGTYRFDRVQVQASLSFGGIGWNVEANGVLIDTPVAVDSGVGNNLGIATFTAFNMSGNAPQPPRFVQFTNCYFEGPPALTGYAARIAAYREATFIRCSFSGGLAGVLIDGASADMIGPLTFISPLIANTYGHGFNFSPADNANFVDCRLVNPFVSQASQSAPDTYDGIYLGANAGPRFFNLYGGSSGRNLFGGSVQQRFGMNCQPGNIPQIWKNPSFAGLSGNTAVADVATTYPSATIENTNNHGWYTDANGNWIPNIAGRYIGLPGVPIGKLWTDDIDIGGFETDGTTVTTASGSTYPVPANCNRYLVVTIGGTPLRIPCYNP